MTVKLLFAGDFMPGHVLEEKARTAGRWEPFVEEAASFFAGADVAFANLECPVVDGDCRARPDKGAVLSCTTAAAPLFKALGLTVVSLANNHLHDCGDDGAASTVKFLDGLGIAAAGVVSDGRPEGQWAVVEVKGLKVGVLACTTSASHVRAKTGKGERYRCFPSTEKELEWNLEELRVRCDFMVLSMHWGFERHLHPSPSQIATARRAVDLGADLVVGHHPHLVQGAEVYKGKHIFYSLGHLLFSDYRSRGGGLHRWRRENRHGLLVEATVREKGAFDVEVIPLYLDEHCRLIPFQGSGRDRILREFASRSAKLRLPAESYRKFWLAHHFDVEKEYLADRLRDTAGAIREEPAARLKQTAKLLALLGSLLIDRLLGREPRE